MKAVQAKDLIVGTIYSDTAHLDKISTFLKFKTIEGHLACFEYVGGHKTYSPSSDGLIRLGTHAFFGELAESEIEQYLPTNTAKPE